VRQLLTSDLAQSMRLSHFQVGSEGRSEDRIQRAVRFFTGPLVLAVAIVRHRADIVHLNTSLLRKSYWRDLVYLLVARVLRRKVIFQVHGGFLPMEFVAGSAFSSWVLSCALQLCDVVVVLAQTELVAYRQFVPRTRVLLIPNAIEPSAFANEPRAIRAHEPLRLAYLGRIVREKGIFEIIHAVKALADRQVNVRLSIAGSGPDERSVRNAVTQAGIEGRVRMMQPIFGAAKFAFWADSDVFVFPTYHREGLPYALLESMAAGAVPVVCPVAAVPDVVQDGISGLFVVPRDSQAVTHAIVRLDEDRAGLARMARAARDRVAAHYTIAKLVEHFRQLYESL
jgi:glycosyltransferase involved in cell wall biosynthesis